MILLYILQSDLISALSGSLVVPTIKTRSSPLINLRDLGKSFFKRLGSNCVQIQNGFNYHAN